MTPVFHHVGVYAYRPGALAAYPGWEVGPLEEVEGVEVREVVEVKEVELRY
jgi:3-deoxy-manno-octulosonate cytidylyltransferase (CMP-KDO synthetase)